MDLETTARIRALNDRLRQTGCGGRIMITPGVQTEGEDFLREALNALRTYAEFGPRNDPYAEHDFGALVVGSQKLFWKIDYYNRTLSRGAEDPSSPANCTRVLTIMLASEY